MNLELQAVRIKSEIIISLVYYSCHWATFIIIYYKVHLNISVAIEYAVIIDHPSILAQKYIVNLTFNNFI